MREIDWLRNNPVIYAKEVLGINLWSKQAEIANAVRHSSRVTVRSASAVGKTCLAACVTLWFLSCFHPCTVITFAKSHRQVKEQLWREVGARWAQTNARGVLPIGGAKTQTSLTLAENWFANGFSTDEPDRITGFHNKHVLVIVDEASGVPEEVYGAIENPLAAGFTRLLLLGNPTQSVGRFRDSFTSTAYKPFVISAFDTPAFTNEGDYPFLISRDYVDQKRKDWGEDSALYQVYILGQFPSGETDRLIPFGSAEQAIDRIIKPSEGDVIAMGIDTARFGDDETALYIRHGNKVTHWKVWKRAGTEENVGRIIQIIKEYKPSIINIDEGYNPGVVDGIRAQGYPARAVSFQSSPKDGKTFANIRAEMFWHLADLFKQGEIQIPDDKVLLKQLTDIKKRPLDRYDHILIESKEDMKKRGLKSPDRADALALCFMTYSRRGPMIRWI